MDADGPLAGAEQRLTEAVDAIETAKATAPAWAIDSLRLLRAELLVTVRRLQNCRKAIRGSGAQVA